MSCLGVRINRVPLYKFPIIMETFGDGCRSVFRNTDIFCLRRLKIFSNLDLCGSNNAVGSWASKRTTVQLCLNLS